MALSSYDVRFILSVQDRTGNSLRRFAGDMNKTTAQAARMRKAFTAMDVGRGMAIRGLLAGAGLGIAAEQAASFESSVTKAATQIRRPPGKDNSAQVAKDGIKLQQQLLSIMHQFPGAAQDQASAAYDIFSAMNVPLKKGVGLLKLFNMVAVAGATDLSTSSDAMIKILNNFGGSWSRVMKSVQTSFAIIRFGKLEFSEFNTMLDSVVPAAKGAGQSLEDVSGAMAFLTTKMGPNVAATGLSRLLDVLARPDFRRGAKRLGLDFETIDGSLKPLPDLIHELSRLPVAKIKGAIGSLIPLVTSIGRGGGKGIQAQSQARRTLNQLVLNDRQYQQFQKNVLGATDEFTKRYAAMIGSSGVKWEKFKATLQATAIVVGAAVIPYFMKLGDVISKGIDWAKNNKGTVDFIAKAILAISVASLLAGTFLKLYGAAQIVFLGFKRLAIGQAVMTGWIRLTAISEFLVILIGTRLPAAFMRGYIAMMTFSLGAGRSVGLLAGASRAVLLFATAFTTLNFTGMKAALSLVPLAGMLAKFARIGVITIGISIVWNLMKKEKRDKAWFFAKKGLLGSALSESIFGTDFGMSKWFATDETKKAIDDFEKKQKAARKDPMGKIAKGIQSDFKKMIAQIKKDVGGLGKDIFNRKMLKDMKLDPKSIEDQINAILYPEGGGKGGADDKAQRAKEYAKNVVDRTKDIMKQAADALQTAYTGFREENQSAFGSIFEPVAGQDGEEQQLRKAWNWKTGANSLLGVMRARVTQFKKWRGMLSMLLKKGFSKDFVAEFKKMGPEGLQYLDELKRAGPKKVQEFNTVMAQGKGAVTKATEIDFGAQMKKWNSFGKETALKMILGMESDEPKITKRMTNMVSRMYAAVAKEIATQQVKLEMTVPDATVTLDYSGLTAKPDDKTKPKPTKPKLGHHPKGQPAVEEGQNVYLPGRVSTIPATQRGQYSPQTGMTQVFHINGMFLTYQEMMDVLLRTAKNKNKHTR